MPLFLAPLLRNPLSTMQCSMQSPCGRPPAFDRRRDLSSNSDVQEPQTTSRTTAKESHNDYIQGERGREPKAPLPHPFRIQSAGLKAHIVVYSEATYISAACTVVPCGDALQKSTSQQEGF
jgi:hypothetical protein